MIWPKNNYFETIDYKKILVFACAISLIFISGVIFLAIIYCLMLACMDKASAIKTVELGSIPSQIKPNTTKLVFTASRKNQCEASTVSSIQVGSRVVQKTFFRCVFLQGA